MTGTGGVRPITPENFPAGPKEDAVWLGWRYEKGTKVPKVAGRRSNAASDNPDTWSSYERAVRALEEISGYYSGIGMVFTEDDPLIGGDLDHCRDPETGVIEDWALEIIREMDTYTEVSPSGTGVKMWACGELAHNSYCKKLEEGSKRGIEIYAGGRWFAVTGWHLEGTPRTINRRTTQMTKLVKKHFPNKFKPREAPQATRAPYVGGDEFDVENWLAEQGVPIAGETSDNQGRKWKLSECPRAERHSTSDASGAYVGQMYGDGGTLYGPIYARCSHSSCGGGDQDLWHDLRRAYEPGWEPHKTIKVNFGKRRREGGGSTSAGTSSDARDDSTARNANESPNLTDLPDPLDFPTDALPPCVAQFIEETAASVGCPVDFVAVPALVALSSAIGDTRRVVLKRSWTEGAAIFGGIVGEAATKKSPAMSLALRPVRDRQMALKAKYEHALVKHEAALRDHKKASKDGPTESAPPEPPTLGRTYVDDTTVERAADILNENPRGLALTRDELSSWLASMNQYKAGGKGSDRQFWLSVHTNQPIAVDRKSSDRPVIVAHPFVSIIGGIQPAVLPDFGKDRGDGLMERFIFAYPEHRPSRWTDDEVGDETIEGYAATVNALYGLEHADAGDGPFPSRVPMTPDAKALFVEEYNALHDEIEAPGFPARLRPAFGKLEAYLARFALILAMVRISASNASNASNFPKEEVTETDMRGAIKLLGYFKNHARRVYVGLYGASPADRLEGDLKDFLVSRKGTWEGSAQALYDDLKSDYKPERHEDLAKFVRACSKRSPLLHLEDMPRKDNRRPFRLTLENAGNAGIAGRPAPPYADLGSDTGGV